MAASVERIFVPRLKPYVHIGELVIVVAVMILCGVRLTTLDSSAPRTRTDSMALAIGGKSLVVIFYQLLSEHVAKFSRYASLKANLILNCLEVLLWAAVAFMAIQANTKSCHGASCQLSWAILAISILLSNLSGYVTGISIFAFVRSRKENGKELSSLSSGNSIGNRAILTSSHV